MFSTKGNGTGVDLVLAISKKIIEDHCGNIRVASSSRKGQLLMYVFL